MLNEENVEEPASEEASEKPSQPYFCPAIRVTANRKVLAQWDLQTINVKPPPSTRATPVCKTPDATSGCPSGKVSSCFHLSDTMKSILIVFISVRFARNQLQITNCTIASLILLLESFCNSNQNDGPFSLSNSKRISIPLRESTIFLYHTRAFYHPIISY